MSEIQTPARINIVNLAPWPVYFKRMLNAGEISIQANATISIERDEVIQQCYGNNEMFLGVDGHGAHARIMINDKQIREQFSIPDDQVVPTDEYLDKAFGYKTQAAFEKNIAGFLKYPHEVYRILDYVRRKNINDYAKIRYIEKMAEARLD
jgi:hypothetical protein